MNFPAILSISPVSSIKNASRFGLLSAIFLASCLCGRGQPVVARVTSIDGDCQMSLASADWVAAAPDTEFILGDAFRTGPEGRAVIFIVGQGELEVGPDSLVRFATLEDAQQGESVRVAFETGSLGVSSEQEDVNQDLVIDSPSGRVRVESGTRANLRLDSDRNLQLQVEVGLAQLERDDETQDVRAGQTIEISFNRSKRQSQTQRSQAQNTEPAQDADVSEETDAAADADDVISMGEFRIAVDWGAEHEFVLRTAGAIIHDPQKRGAFTISWSPLRDCNRYAMKLKGSSGRVLLEVESEGTEIPLKNIPYGRFSWTVACVRDGGPDWSKVRSGRFARHGDRSSGAKISLHVPRNSLESNGRFYTVTYQNRLPAVRLRWSTAPEANRYLLEVFENSSGRRVHRGYRDRPAQSFRSGFFRQGTYYWYFRTDEASGAKTSPVTRVRIAYDGSSPELQIAEPREGARVSGGTVRVRGAAMLGATVTVNGIELDINSAGRFDQEIALGDTQSVLVFRTSTSHGGGFYLRHLSRGSAGRR